MEEINLKDLFNMVWSRKIIILLIVVLFTGMGVFYTKYMTVPDYKSTATLALTKNTQDNEEMTQTEVTLNQKLVATYSEWIKSDRILKETISNLGIEGISEDSLKNNISVTLVTNSQLIEVSVTNANPETAQKITNELTKVFINTVEEIYNINNIRLYAEADLPTQPYNINNTKNILMFAFIGVIVAIGYVFIASMLDTTIKSAEDAEKRLGLNVLASIPNYNYETKKRGKKDGERRTNNI